MSAIDTGNPDTAAARPCGCLGFGRHRNTCPLKQEGDVVESAQSAAPAPPGPPGYGLPIMPDEWLEQFGGDLAAKESYGPHSRVPSVRSARMSGLAQPDLSYKGLLVYRHAPEKEFHFTYLEEDGSPNYRRDVQALRYRGYTPVTVADFYVHSRLRDVFIPEDNTATGRLTLGGALRGGTTVIYAQPAAMYWKMRKEERLISDHIQQTAEQQAAQMQQDLARDGFAVTMTTELTDGQ